MFQELQIYMYRGVFLEKIPECNLFSRASKGKGPFKTHQSPPPRRWPCFIVFPDFSAFSASARDKLFRDYSRLFLWKYILITFPLGSIKNVSRVKCARAHLRASRQFLFFSFFFFFVFNDNSSLRRLKSVLLLREEKKYCTVQISSSEIPLAG